MCVCVCVRVHAFAHVSACMRCVCLCVRAVYYVLCITMNFIKWLMNLIKSALHLPQLTSLVCTVTSHLSGMATLLINALQKHFCLASLRILVDVP